ncbi:hypothetical protein ACH4OW_22725 [Streptomyces sp. NPDC017056]|uniref:hypothetical protein n=1 Tax=Streptomyces sp. NPDC017056 TaxID=3364973 RepID=UPI0037928FDF
MRNSLSQASSGMGRLQRSAQAGTGALNRIKNSGAQAQSGINRVRTASTQGVGSLTKLATGAGKANTALGKLRTGATQAGTGVNKVKTSVTQSTSAFTKAKAGTDKLKSSLDKLKSSANTAQKALRDVKKQSDAVEKSVGKAGKNADRTGKSMGGLGKGLKGASLAQKGLNLAMSASPFGLIMTLLAPLIAKFVSMDKVVAVAKRGFEVAWRAIQSATDRAMKFLTPVLRGVVNLFTAPIRGLINAMNGAIRGLNRIKVNIPGWVPVFGGKSFGLSIPTLPNIPALAEGGIVPARRGGRLALIAEGGEAEAVIPLSKLQRLMGGHPGGSAALHRLARAVEELADRPVHVQVDSQTIARAVFLGRRQLARR